MPLHACNHSTFEHIELPTSLPESQQLPPSPPSPLSKPLSRNIKQALQFLNKRPLIITHIRPVILLQRIDALPRYQRVQHIFLLQVAAVHGLVGAFDLDGDRGLALFADGDLFVVALDGLAGWVWIVLGLWIWIIVQGF